VEGEVGVAMMFLGPAWLLALIPWGALALWSMFGRRKRTWVPYLPLWDAPEELKRPRKGFEPPPVALVMALLATLLGLVATARPMLNAQTDRGRLTIVVDRGESMSARVNGRARYADLAARSHPGSPRRWARERSISSTPSGHRWRPPIARTGKPWSRGGSERRSTRPKPFARPCGNGWSAARASSCSRIAIWGSGNDQLIQVKPRQNIHNAGIVALAHSAGEVMVTLRATEATSRTLRVQCGDQTVSPTVDLNPGADQNVFGRPEHAGGHHRGGTGGH